MTFRDGDGPLEKLWGGGGGAKYKKKFVQGKILRLAYSKAPPK